MKKQDWVLITLFSVAMLSLPLWGPFIGAGYPDIMQKFAIFGLFAIGFNLLFGLTGYLSFGQAAFLGVGSYTAVWVFKLLTMDVILAIVLATLMGGFVAFLMGIVALRRSGIYFSILTLAFAEMMFRIAYSDLLGGFFGTSITNGETGLQLTGHDPRILDALLGRALESGLPSTSIFGVGLSSNGYIGFYLCAFFAILGLVAAVLITRSSFGTVLRGIKANKNRLNYTGISTRPYLITTFVISGMYAGLAGGLMAATDPLAGAERMQWTASGEVVLMTILGGVGTLIGPVLGAGVIKLIEAKVSSWNEMAVEHFFAFLPENLNHGVAFIVSKFVGEGWHLSLGLIFMLVVIFLPGGIMEGVRRIQKRINRSPDKKKET